MRINIASLINIVLSKKCNPINIITAPPDIITIVGNSVILYSSFNPGITCKDPVISDLPKISISPCLFGITEKVWVSSVDSVETLEQMWCNKIIDIKIGEIVISGIVYAYCPLKKYNYFINFSNGEKIGRKCFYNNSINFLYDKGTNLLNEKFNSNFITSDKVSWKLV